jgi:putative addiction module killer protein
MYRTKKTDTFVHWHSKLKDIKAKIAIGRGIDRMAQGNFGKSEPVGDGVSELKIDLGPGYRVYYFIHDKEIIILLIGGDKSTQQKDINRAKEMAKEYKNG